MFTNSLGSLYDLFYCNYPPLQSLHTPRFIPTSYPFSILYHLFFNKPTSSSWTVHVLLGAGASSEFIGHQSGPTSLKKFNSSPRLQQLSVILQLGLSTYDLLLLHARVLAGLILYRPYKRKHDCWEFMSEIGGLVMSKMLCSSLTFGS